MTNSDSNPVVTIFKHRDSDSRLRINLNTETGSMTIYHTDDRGARVHVLLANSVAGLVSALNEATSLLQEEA